jgi:hypothetical protein
MRAIDFCIIIAASVLLMASRASAVAGPACTTSADLFGQPGGICTMMSPSLERSCTDSRQLLATPFSPPACVCKAPQLTPDFTGTGSTCDQANNSVFNQANNWINSAPRCVNTDGICYTSNVIVTIACSFNSGMGVYTETGHLVFKCLFCE